MTEDEATLRALLGGVRLIARVQHPKIHIDATANRNYFFRFWTDQIQPDGTQKAIRMRHVCWPSKGPKKISLKDAEMIRDDELRKINAPNAKIAAAKGQALFGEVANMYLTSHVDRRGKMAAPSREKEKWMVKAFLLPAWEKRNGDPRRLYASR